MNIVDLVVQLKTYCTLVAGRVAGAGDFAAGLEAVANLPLPAAFVYPIADDAEPNTDMNGLQQLVWENFAVTVQFDATVGSLADGRSGFTGVNQVEEMKEAIWSSILNWQPPSMIGKAARGIEYVAGDLLDFDRARLFWQFTFRILRTITDADGFVVPPQDLVEIQVTMANPVTGSVGPIFVINTEEC